MSGLSPSDLKILSILQKEGDISNVELAERIGMSPSPCLRKVKSLREAGYIQDVAALLDRRKLGFEVIAYVDVKVPQITNANIVDEFNEAVNKETYITECYLTSGNFDFRLKIVIENIDSYSDLLTNILLKLPGVKDTNSIFALKTIKYSTSLPI